MVTYEEIIREQRQKLRREINWWPSYLYHFTDVNHAVSILDKGWIYGRAVVEQQHLTKTDAASHNVLDVTGDDIKQCGRLYMRPLTPPQFYNEGYKPEIVRHKDYKDANCPVPVFFLFDAAKTLSYPGVYFIEKGAAGHRIKASGSGPEAFAQLQFDKIFHYGSLGYTSDIGQYRRTEVLRDGGIPLNGLLKRVVCRSVAERQTTLSLLQERCPGRYEIYKQLVTVATPEVGTFLFNYNGIYIKAVKALLDKVHIEFNEAVLRYDQNKTRKGKVPVTIRVALYWLDQSGTQIIEYDLRESELDYKLHNAVNVVYKQRCSDRVKLEVCLDGNLVFQGEFDLSDHDLIS